MIISYPVNEIAPYINWIYFFHAWGFEPKYAAIANIHGCDACRAMWLASFAEAERNKASEAMQLHKEAMRMLREMEDTIEVKSIFRLCQANSDGNDLIIEDIRLPLLRQQKPHPKTDVCLCLSDFVPPIANGIPDKIGVFASSAPATIEKPYSGDAYRLLLAQTLADRLAEAATERLHLYVRTKAWGYAPHEQLSIPQLLAEEFQGIRPAVGYPSLPDQSINFLLDQLIDMKQIGITLTENGAMHPHASVSGLMIAHPQARYFQVGHISLAQLEDYAHRRNLPIEEMKRFLVACYP